jgi:hypothetical protein
MNCPRCGAVEFLPQVRRSRVRVFDCGTEVDSMESIDGPVPFIFEGRTCLKNQVKKLQETLKLYQTESEESKEPGSSTG